MHLGTVHEVLFLSQQIQNISTGSRFEVCKRDEFNKINVDVPKISSSEI